MHDAQQMRGLRGSFCTKSVADPRVIPRGDLVPRPSPGVVASRRLRPLPAKSGARLRGPASHARAPLQLSNSHALKKENLICAHAPSVSRSRRKAGGPVFPLDNEGDDAPKGATGSFSRVAPALRRPLRSAHRLSARHRGFSVRGTVLPGTGQD